MGKEFFGKGAHIQLGPVSVTTQLSFVDFFVGAVEQFHGVVCLCSCVFVHLCICAFVHLCICALDYLCICLFVDLCICAFVDLCICAFVH